MEGAVSGSPREVRPNREKSKVIANGRQAAASRGKSSGGFLQGLKPPPPKEEKTGRAGGLIDTEFKHDRGLQGEIPAFYERFGMTEVMPPMASGAVVAERAVNFGTFRSSYSYERTNAQGGIRAMTNRTRQFLPVFAFLAASFLFAPLGTQAQTNSSQSSTSASGDRWLHVRVVSTDGKGETVRVNVPLELAEKVLPAIDHDRLHNGRVRINDVDSHGVDLKSIFEAVRTTKDGEFVTVQDKDEDVSVAKKGEQLLIHVHDKKNKAKDAHCEVTVPMKVVDALLSAGKDELDLVAGLRALSKQGDVELVSVKDDENTVRVWLDSKNVTTD
jgi:hypothetical protein